MKSVPKVALYHLDFMSRLITRKECRNCRYFLLGHPSAKRFVICSHFAMKLIWTTNNTISSKINNGKGRHTVWFNETDYDTLIVQRKIFFTMDYQRFSIRLDQVLFVRQTKYQKHIYTFLKLKKNGHDKAALIHSVPYSSVAILLKFTYLGFIPFHFSL